MEDTAARLNAVHRHDRTRTTDAQGTTALPVDSRTDWPALEELRRRYQEDRDLFSAHERARLRFLRWLNQMRRLVP
jgi:hypothetical protein